jgi:antitoxin component YwqK of YwqJK toxin-antitoxin module
MKGMHLSCKYLIINIIFIWCLSSSFSNGERNYKFNYYDHGAIKSHGWIANNIMNGYWKFYFPNGKLEREGHFLNNKEQDYWFYYDEKGNKIREGHYLNGKMNKWWSFYENEQISFKCEYEKDKKNGYCIIFSNEKPVKVMHYINDVKTNEWGNYLSFIRDNPTVNPQ